MSTIIKYTFGDEKQYYYEFNFNGYLIPGTDSVITTVLMISTNMGNKHTSLVDPYIPDFIQFMAKLCLEYNASYDGYHNYLVPYTFDDSINIAEQVNDCIELMKNP